MVLSKRYRKIMESLLRQYPAGLNQLRILDVGDYYPTVPLYLHDQGALVSVVDLDFTIETEKLYAEHLIEFAACDLNEVRTKRIPFTDSRFDIIIWLEVIEHLKCSPKYVFKEFSRLLKHCGLLVIGTPNAGRLSSRLRYLMGRHPYLFSLEPFYFGAEQFIGHRREYFIHEIDTLLRWNGYEILERIFFNGTISDHKSKGLLRAAPHLFLTYLFKPLRWIYIAIARNTGNEIYEPSTLDRKRV